MITREEIREQDAVLQAKADFLEGQITHQEVIAILSGVVQGEDALELVMNWDQIKCGSPDYQ